MGKSFIKSKITDFSYPDFKLKYPIEETIIPKLQIEFEKNNIDNLMESDLWDDKLFNIIFANRYVTNGYFLHCLPDHLSSILTNDNEIAIIMRVVEVLDFIDICSYKTNLYNAQVLKFLTDNMDYLIIIYLTTLYHYKEKLNWGKF